MSKRFKYTGETQGIMLMLNGMIILPLVIDFRSVFGFGGCYLLMHIIKKSTGFGDVVATGIKIKF